MSENVRQKEREKERKREREKEREVKRCARQDKRSFVVEKAREAEEAARRQDTRTLYKIGKSLGKGREFGGQGHVKDKDGIVLTRESDQRER